MPRDDLDFVDPVEYSPTLYYAMQQFLINLHGPDGDEYYFRLKHPQKAVLYDDVFMWVSPMVPREKHPNKWVLKLRTPDRKVVFTSYSCDDGEVEVLNFGRMASGGPVSVSFSVPEEMVILVWLIEQNKAFTTGNFNPVIKENDAS